METVGQRFRGSRESVSRRGESEGRGAVTADDSVDVLNATEPGTSSG